MQEHFHLEKKTEIDYFDSDVRTCSFLNRDAEGNYRFVHRSFGEFFVAQWLAPRLLDGSAPEMRINEEVRGFVHGLLQDAPWPPPAPEGVQVPEGMVWVPPGPFIYGERGRTCVARLDHGFFVARTPVTNVDYARFVEAIGHEPPLHWHGKSPPAQLRDHPVVYVTWYDAIAYAKWAGLGLPTEQEWEKAARGIDGRIYPWGDAFDPARCNTTESDIDITTPVGRYSPHFHPEQWPELAEGRAEGGDSPCGCADMAGNVWEWMASEWEPGDERRVLRGGAFCYDARYVRCAYRLKYNPFNRYRVSGFRVVASRASE